MKVNASNCTSLHKEQRGRWSATPPPSTHFQWEESRSTWLTPAARQRWQAWGQGHPKSSTLTHTHTPWKSTVDANHNTSWIDHSCLKSSCLHCTSISGRSYNSHEHQPHSTVWRTLLTCWETFFACSMSLAFSSTWQSVLTKSPAMRYFTYSNAHLITPMCNNHSKEFIIIFRSRFSIPII